MKDIIDKDQEHVNHFTKVLFLVFVGATILFCGTVILFVL